MMIHVILSVPRPSLWAKFVGQFYSIIISTTVASPLNLLLSIGASSFESLDFVLGFFDAPGPTTFYPEAFPLVFEVVFVSFKSEGLETLSVEV